MRDRRMQAEKDCPPAAQAFSFYKRVSIELSPFHSEYADRLAEGLLPAGLRCRRKTQRSRSVVFFFVLASTVRRALTSRLCLSKASVQSYRSSLPDKYTTGRYFFSFHS